MRQGLAEWVVVTAVLVLAATAGSLRWGGELRAAFGVAPPASTLPRSSPR
jgi:hypothetical protein